MSSIKRLFIDEWDEIVHEFLFLKKDLDIETCLMLIKIDIAARVSELWILANEARVGELFSDQDGDTWTPFERALANILRWTSREIERRLDERESLLLKQWEDISPEDEKRWDEIEGEIHAEILAARESIGRVIHGAIPVLVKSWLC